MIGRSELLALLREQNVSVPTLGQPVVAVVTRDRPILLRRCLETYIRNVREFGRRPGFFVFDDSLSEEAATHNRARAKAAGTELGIAVEYFGRAEARDLRDRLVQRASVPPQVVDFALFGDSTTPVAHGANRNRVLLRTAGARVISVDDDTVCRLFAASTTTTWAVESSDTRDTSFFADRGSAFAHLSEANADFVQLYEGVVGQSPAALLSGCRDLVSRTLEPRTLSTLFRPDARILYCMPGIAGDCAEWSSGVLHLTGVSREQAMTTAAVYRLASTTRNVIKGVRLPTMSDTRFLMAYAIGLDNRTSLPPFLPLERNSDGLFGILCSKILPAMLHVELPYAIAHDPEGGRQFREGDPAAAVWRARLCDIIGAACDSFRPASPLNESSERLSALGKHLESLGSRPLEEFEEVVRERLRSQWIHRAAHLDRLLSNSGARPAYWAADVQRALGGLHAVLVGHEKPIVPVDVAGRTELEKRQLSQRVSRLFGSLLMAWPQLRAAAADIVSLHDGASDK